MIPSRGLRWSTQYISVGRRRVELLSARSFSSTSTPNGFSKSISLAKRAGAWGCSAPLTPQMSCAVSAIRNGAFIRFQSTTRSTSGAKDALVSDVDKAPWAQESADVGSLDQAIDLTSIDLANVPETIGYLKAIGLDYGYGPTGLMEWILEHVHVYAGTPWWASIVLTAVLVRLAVLYPNIIASDNAAKLAKIAPLTRPLMDRIQESARQSNTAETMRLRGEISALNRRAGVKYWKAFVPMIQAPIGFGTFFLLRKMANLPVPGLENGGLLWFYNLTKMDPLFLLPIATAGTLHVLLKRGGESGVQSMSPGFMLGMSYVIPLLTLLFTALQPSAIQLTFFVTGVISFGQAELFRWAPFRIFMNMAPLPKKQKPDASASDGTGTEPSPYQPRIVTASSSPSASASSASYEPPRSPESGPAATKPTLLSGLKREVSSGISSVQESARKTLKSAREITGQESKDGKRTKKQLQQANAYEKKRRLEEAKKRQEADSRRRARRMSKTQSL